MPTYTALGVMSGSSLDGLDLALCTFTVDDDGWRYTLDDAYTLPYEEPFRQRLRQVMQGTALELTRMDRDLGDLIGHACTAFLRGRPVDVIASHGHTVFHQPDEGLTLQIGHGARIAAVTGLPVVTDFRTMDVALGGQGAPLVPLGERLLFPEHRNFLNLGGICNIAHHGPAGVLGYDVCIGNQALNLLAEEAGHAFDRDGELARSGTVDNALLERLNALPFHQVPPPRSLGREWFEAEVRPLITDATLPLRTRLRTVVEHIAMMIDRSFTDRTSSLLTTGGGAHNGFPVERLNARLDHRVVVPGKRLVDFKEALIFAMLGVRRLRAESTALADVTGATAESVGGALHAGRPGRAN